MGNIHSTLDHQRGLCQGCILSPLLFCIYIDDLLRKIRSKNLGVRIGQAVMSSLCYADDLILAGSENEVKTLLRELEAWCKDNDFKISVRKSHIVKVGGKEEEG